MPKNYDEVQEWIDNMVKKAAFLDDMTESMTTTNNDIKFYKKVMQDCRP